MCSNRGLLGGTLRDDWGFSGHVVSDCGAVGFAHEFRINDVGTLPNATAQALTAGTDMNCGSSCVRLCVRTCMCACFCRLLGADRCCRVGATGGKDRWTSSFSRLNAFIHSCDHFCCDVVVMLKVHKRTRCRPWKRNGD